MHQPGKNLMSNETNSSILDNQGRGKVGEFPIDEIQTVSKISAAFCPHCKTITNLSVSLIPVIDTDPDGKEIILTSRTYHCENCGLFVRCEEDGL